MEPSNVARTRGLLPSPVGNLSDVKGTPVKFRLDSPVTCEHLVDQDIFATKWQPAYSPHGGLDYS